MQFPGAASAPVSVLFDSAFDRIGDLLALAMLYGLDGKGELRVAAISVSRPDFAAAQYADVIKRFYAGAGGFGFGASFPVGLASGPAKPLPVFGELLAKHKPTIEKMEETADPATLLRNALSACQPHDAIVIAAGPLTSLARMLSLSGCKEMIALNVRHLAIAGGPQAGADTKSAQRVFDEWPTPIYACSPELGDELRFPGASIEKDFAWSNAHPVADAYRAFQPMPYDAPTAAMDAALYAARPKAGYFKLSEPGIFRASAASVTLTPSAHGKHQFLLPDESQSATVIQALTELASAKPVVRARRGPRSDANADQPPPVKKQ